MSTKKQSGGGRLKTQGKTLIWVTVTAAEKHDLRLAAAALDLPMSQFLKAQGLTAAQKILKKMSA